MLYRDWPFFSSALDNAEFALFRVEPQIASLYVALAEGAEGPDGPDGQDGQDGQDARRLWAAIREEYERTLAALRRVTGQDQPLASDPDARRSIHLRRPYIDPLSYLQVGSLPRLRALPDVDPQAARLRGLVQLTVNGVAAGLQSTG